MPYIRKRGNVYYYDRRIPNTLKQYDPREKVRISLHTDSERIAEERSISVNNEIEAYWRSLVSKGETHSDNAFMPILQAAKLLGFNYMPSHELAKEPMTEIINRLNMVKHLPDDSDLVEVKLGGAAIPSISLSQALEKFWNISNDKIMGKSESQIRKWRNPRIKAMNNLIKLCGDKSLKELHRDDILSLKDWWIERITNEGKRSGSANKDIIHVKNVIEAVSEHEQIDINIEWLFNKMSLKEHVKSTRTPFDNEFIQNELLQPRYHTELNDDAKYILYALADTGARPSEIVGLRPDDIIVDTEIPHIKIRPYEGRSLKTYYSERDIPLVGCSLWAFKQMPNGFARYRDRKSGADNLSALLNKHLKAKKLLPTDSHSVYSLRHSFQDRLTNLAVPDRIQCQLMGHLFKDRIEYGQGADLAKKQEWLLKMCFKQP